MIKGLKELKEPTIIIKIEKLVLRLYFKKIDLLINSCLFSTECREFMKMAFDVPYFDKPNNIQYVVIFSIYSIVSVPLYT